MVASSFKGARRKLTIGSLDNDLLIKAHYNPHELQIEKQIPWQEHAARDNRAASASKPKPVDNDLEFNGAPKRTMTLELLFDRYETGESVRPDVHVLEELSSVRDPTDPKHELKRPHYCVVVWGEDGVPPFRCVIESLGVKYTMFNRDGVPLRAVCTLKLKEASLRALLKAKLDNLLSHGWSDWVPPEER